MKYILNETPVRTSNNFNVNDFRINLDIVKKEYSSFNSNIDFNVEIKKDFNSKIGLNSEEYLNLKILLDKDNNEPYYLKYNGDYLVNSINIEVNENINNSFIIVYEGDNSFINSKIIINLKNNSNLNLSIINLSDSNSNSFISIESYLDDYSKLNTSFIDLSGNIKVSNYYGENNGLKSETMFNSLYIGKDNDKIDMNYYIKNNNKNTNSNINVVGVLDNNSVKNFKGIIDFSSNSSKSVGEENEKCILLSDKCISKSLPILLCHEDDVTGSHGVSNGQLDEDLLFYLMSRGIDEKEAKKIIIMADFNSIISNIEIKDLIVSRIDELLK